MHRFHLPSTQCQGAELRLTEREAHHALHVLRVRPGERAVVLDGAGAEYLCEVRATERDAVRLAVVQKNTFPPLACRLTLLQAVPKARAMDAIVQKATELGAARIVPLLSARTVPQVDDESAEARRLKWLTIAIEAVKQCGNPWLPEIETPVTPREYLARGEHFELPLVASLQNDRRHPRHHFQRFLEQHGRPPATACVWIGPEGDFTPAEMNAIKADGALPITLGPLILRSETAALYSLAVLSYELLAAAGGDLPRP